MDNISQKNFQYKLEKNMYSCMMISGILFTSGSFSLLSFVPTITELAKLALKVLGQLAQQFWVLQKEQYQFLYFIDSQPTAAAWCWADRPNTPTHPPLISGGGTAPCPLPWQGEGTCLENFIILGGPIAQHAVG